MATKTPESAGDELPTGRDLTDNPVVISSRGLSKSFRIPERKVDSIKERAVHPFRRQPYRDLEVLKDVNFDIHEGEFFGITGRNGSGKSTLLKILASIYPKDGGSLKVAGKLAPFIELGVGFNLDLNARENIVLNALMMGMPRKLAESRIESVLEFAELKEFADLKLKNYSSGMLVRLAFSTMLEADVDILLIDEVLAVGDAAFMKKCDDAFIDMRAAGKTVILVTHDMDSVERLCDRAMLLEDGRIKEIGAPGDVGREYMRSNFADAAEEHDRHLPKDQRAALMLGAWLEDEQGTRIYNVPEGGLVRSVVELEIREEIPAPMLVGAFSTYLHSEIVHVTDFRQKPVVDGKEIEVLTPGQRITFATEFESPFKPDRYSVTFRLCRNDDFDDVAMQMVGAIDFVVFGTSSQLGLVEVEMKHEARLAEPGPGPEEDSGP
ncbi:MAG: ABC transporter ATP-binding protein [Solirubrobacterales bacterium]|nr:ABC transporter ATP-binding protein [Solirubrobacterales bacterium]